MHRLTKRIHRFLDRMERRLDHLALRFDRAITAFRGPISDQYAVIFDRGSLDDPKEEYYGYFADEWEARMLFDTAYPPGYPGSAHNAYLVRIVKQLRPARY